MRTGKYCFTKKALTLTLIYRTLIIPWESNPPPTQCNLNMLLELVVIFALLTYTENKKMQKNKTNTDPNPTTNPNPKPTIDKAPK